MGEHGVRLAFQGQYIPLWLVYLVSGWLTLCAVSNLASQHWLTGLLILALVAYMIAWDRRSRSVPLIELTTGELIVRGRWHPWSMTHVPLASIQSIDCSRAGRVSMHLESGEHHTVHLDSLSWNDRWTFLSGLKSTVSGTCEWKGVIYRVGA